MIKTLDREAFAHLKDIVGDIGNLRLAEILELEPRQDEINEALIWADDIASFVERGTPLSGKVGKIFDILTSPRDVTVH